MKTGTKYRMVLVTCADSREAGRIAAKLLGARLIACANIMRGIRSIFRWKGRIEKAAETLLIMKTVSSKLPEVRRMVRSLHSYEVPEIISLKIAEGDKAYLKWIDESVK